MTITERRPLTLEDFLALPETEPASEYFGGEVWQKVSPQGQHSRLQYGHCRQINDYAEPRKLAMAFPELRVSFAGATLVPDIAVYRWERIPRTPDGKIANRFTEPPALVAEIVSPEQGVNLLVRKCLWYVDHGVRLALVVDPLDLSVLLFRPGARPVPLVEADRIDLDEVLPGFELTVQELFATLRVE